MSIFLQFAHLGMVTKNHATHWNNGYTSYKNEEVEPVQPIQMNIPESNTYGKGFNWLYFKDERQGFKRGSK